jgi:hypothetical protein
VPTSHFSKAGISLNSIWRPIFKNPQKRGPIPKKPNETGNFRGNGRPKKNHENGGQKPTQKRWDNRRRDQPQNDRKTNRKTTKNRLPTQKQGLQTGTFEARGAFRQTANSTISDRL